MSDGLTDDDLRRAVDVVRELSEDRHGWLSALRTFGQLIGCDDIVSARVEVGTGQVVALDRPPADHGADSLAWACPIVVGQHPGFRVYRSGGLPQGAPVAVTDLVGTRALRRTPLYAEVMRPRGIADELLCSATVSDREDIVLVISRTTNGFSQRDRALVSLMAPHVAQNAAWRRRAESAKRAAEDPLPAWSSLTPRERDVSTLVLRGATDREIARALVISTRTAQKHLENIYRKLDVTNRTSLVARLTGAGTHARR